MLISLIVLVAIVGVRTYMYDWSIRHHVGITVVEVLFNLSIFWDFVINLIDAPVKREFLSSMYDFPIFGVNDNVVMDCSTLQRGCL